MNTKKPGRDSRFFRTYSLFFDLNIVNPKKHALRKTTLNNVGLQCLIMVCMYCDKLFPYTLKRKRSKSAMGVNSFLTIGFPPILWAYID